MGTNLGRLPRGLDYQGNHGRWHRFVGRGHGRGHAFCGVRRERGMESTSGTSTGVWWRERVGVEELQRYGGAPDLGESGWRRSSHVALPPDLGGGGHHHLGRRRRFGREREQRAKSERVEWLGLGLLNPTT